MSGYPQTALTKQRESLEEPLKVFTLPSHQHSGFWIPGDGEETINTLRIRSNFTDISETLTLCYVVQMAIGLQTGTVDPKGKKAVKTILTNVAATYALYIHSHILSCF